MLIPPLLPSFLPLLPIQRSAPGGAQNFHKIDPHARTVSFKMIAVAWRRDFIYFWRAQTRLF